MKLLWVSHLLPYPPKGGVLQRSYHLIRQASLRHEVHLAALVQPTMQSTEREREEAISKLRKMCSSVRSFQMVAGQSGPAWWLLAATSFFRSQPYDVHWMHSSEMDAYVRQLAVTERFDLVHLDTLGLMPYADPFGESPLVLNHHNVESQTMLQRSRRESNLLKGFYFRREAAKLRRYERKVCCRVDLNLVVSEDETQRLEKATGQVPMAVVENGVDTEYFNPALPPGENSLGLIFVGGMSFYPNREAMQFVANEVWPQVAESCPQQTLTIIGRDPPPEVRAIADGDRVKAPGFVDDIRPHVDRAAIYICPIRSGGGTRLKILDALAMRKPLVATGFAVNGLGLQDGVHYLRAEAPEEYVRQIRRLEGDPDLRRGLATAGRSLVENDFSWDVVGRHLEESYQRAVSVK